MSRLVLAMMVHAVSFPACSAWAEESHTPVHTGSIPCPCLQESSLSVTFDDPDFDADDYITIAPDATGETLADRGVTITVTVSCSGNPLAGMPPQVFELWTSGMITCAAHWIADGPTDENSVTTFTGTVAGGGCGSQLEVYIEGCFIGVVPIGVNSPDRGTGSPGFVDSADVAALAAQLEPGAAWDPCFDYNGSGPPIDSSDVAFLAQFLGASCP